MLHLLILMEQEIASEVILQCKPLGLRLLIGGKRMKKTENGNEMPDPEMQEILERAEMDATVEQIRDEEDSPEKSAEEQEAEAVNSIENEDMHVLVLSREYAFDGKKVDRLDFSGLPELTTRDLEYADRIIARLQHDPADKYRDTLWAKYIAVRATEYPPEFFNSLNMRYMLGIVGTIRHYFLLGWE